MSSDLIWSEIRPISMPKTLDEMREIAGAIFGDALRTDLIGTENGNSTVRVSDAYEIVVTLATLIDLNRLYHAVSGGPAITTRGTIRYRNAPDPYRDNHAIAVPCTTIYVTWSNHP